MATNQTPVEYCRHCGKEINKCACVGKCQHKSYTHTNRYHICDFWNFNGDPQVAEPADPPPQPDAICGEPAGHFIAGSWFCCVLPKGHEGDHRRGGTCFAHGKYLGDKCPQWPKCAAGFVKAGTQMEERKPDAIINFVRDMIDRAENAHESKPGICVEIPVFMADIARIKQTLRNDVSESANCEPQASPNLDLQMFCEQLRKALNLPDDRIWFGAGLLTVAEQLRERRAKAERELQELRAQRTQYFNEADSLRGLVGRMLPYVQSNGPTSSKRKTLISEAEAAIKEPHND